MTTRSIVSLPLILAAVLVACDRSQTPTPRPSPRSAVAAPDTARAVCDVDGTTLLTHVVRPQPDGVHLQVRNDTGEAMGIRIGSSGGDDAPVGTTTLIWPIAPGQVELACFVVPNETTGKPAALKVVGPDGIYVPDTLACDGAGSSQGIADYVAGTRGETGDLVQIARHDLGNRVRSADVVRLGGYPEQDRPVVIVVRDGRVVASVEYERAFKSTGWLRSVTSTCGDF